MVKINPLNVAKLLFDGISSKYYESTPIYSEEIELKNELLSSYYTICSYSFFGNFILTLALSESLRGASYERYCHRL